MNMHNIAPAIYPEINDIAYSEIDSFKNYEYANCVAYEFAIRNKKVISELERFETKFNDYENKIIDL